VRPEKQMQRKLLLEEFAKPINKKAIIRVLKETICIIQLVF